MYLADGATQALGGLRYNDQVNMIGHQAICPNRDLLCAAKLRHELDVVLVAYRIRKLIDPGVGRGGGALPQERERRDQPRTVRQLAARGLIEEPVGSNNGDPPVTTPGVAQHHQVFSQAEPER